MGSLFVLATATLSAASNPAGLAGVKSFGGTSQRTPNSSVTAKVFTTNETTVYQRDVSPACAASGSCAALMTFLWTVGGKERHGRFIYDNIIMRCAGTHLRSMHAL